MDGWQITWDRNRKKKRRTPPFVLTFPVHHIVHMPHYPAPCNRLECIFSTRGRFVLYWLYYSNWWCSAAGIVTDSSRDALGSCSTRLYSIHLYTVGRWQSMLDTENIDRVQIAAAMDRYSGAIPIRRRVIFSIHFVSMATTSRLYMPLYGDIIGYGVHVMCLCLRFFAFL